jgi:hypothetical protein
VLRFRQPSGPESGGAAYTGAPSPPQHMPPTATRCRLHAPQPPHLEQTAPMSVAMRPRLRSSRAPAANRHVPMSPAKAEHPCNAPRTEAQNHRLRYPQPPPKTTASAPPFRGPFAKPCYPLGGL